MPTATETITLLDKATAYWYACGYNDHRQPGQPWVDGMEFANYWVDLCSHGSHASLQDAFKAFQAPVIHEMTFPDPERCNCGCKYWDQDGLCHSCRQPFTGVMS